MALDWLVVKLIVTIDSWLDLASNPGFCTTLALAQTGPGNNTSVPQIYNLTTVIQFDRNIFGSIVAFGLEPAACGLRPMACGLRPAAYGLRPSAFGFINQNVLGKEANSQIISNPSWHKLAKRGIKIEENL